MTILYNPGGSNAYSKVWTKLGLLELKVLFNFLGTVGFSSCRDGR